MPATGALIDEFWEFRGALATAGLERRGKQHKTEFIGGTGRLQQNKWLTDGYKTLLRRRNIDWALVLIIP